MHDSKERITTRAGTKSLKNNCPTDKTRLPRLRNIFFTQSTCGFKEQITAFAANDDHAALGLLNHFIHRQRQELADVGFSNGIFADFENYTGARHRNQITHLKKADEST